MTSAVVREVARSRAKRLIRLCLRALGPSLGILWLRSLLAHFWWHRGMWSMCLRCCLVNLRRLLGARQKYRVELRHHSGNQQQYAVWWPEGQAKVQNSHRLWVLIPGGMSDGDSVAGYFYEFLRSGAIDRNAEEYCIFHNPGTGGAQWSTRCFVGLSDPTYLSDFLSDLGACGGGPRKYAEVVVVGFSVGGMLALRTAEQLFGNCAEQGAQDTDCGFRFVSVHSPDHIRLTFEEMTKWNLLARIDVPLSVHFWLVCWRSGLLRKCPKGPQWPIRLGWAYIRSFTEASWAQNQALMSKEGGTRTEGEMPASVPFEKFDHEFSLALRSPLPRGRVLRIQNPDDPVVHRSTLDEKGLQCCEVWWVRAGGHVMCFGASPELGRRVRAWVGAPIDHGDAEKPSAAFADI